MDEISSRLPSSSSGLNDDRYELWCSEDRQQKLYFRAVGGNCSVEFTEKRPRRTTRLLIDPDRMRAVAMGNPLLLQGEEATCAFALWNTQIEVRLLSEGGLKCSVPLATYLVGIAWLTCKQRAMVRRKRTVPGVSVAREA
jgi:hypothetical protein